MRKIELEEQKQIQLDILKEVDKFCRERNLRYSLGGGTLLGAVRHKGYIPWDDDIDIMMPRPDYDNFVKTFNGYREHLVCGAYENDEKYYYTFAKIYDKRTYWKQKGSRYTIGINIDLFPIDGIPDCDTVKFKIFLLKFRILRTTLYAKDSDNILL